MNFADDPDLHWRLLGYLAEVPIGLPPLDRRRRARWREELVAVVRRAQAILDLDDACCAEFLEAFEREGLQFEVARACHERGDPAPEGTFYGPPEGWPGAMDPPRLAP